jgi:glycosyltransferase involved in cell wall biosynthesis
MATVPGSLWVDVGSLLNHTDSFAGIQRTTAHLLAELFRADGLPLRLCRYNARRRRFGEVQRRTLADLPILDRSGWRGMPGARLPVARALGRLARPALEALPWELQEACAEWAGAARHLARWAGRTASAPVRWLARLRRLARPRPGCPFAPGDVLLLLSNGWQDAGVCEALLALKRAMPVRMVTLIYDVIPALMPQFVRPEQAAAFEAWARKMIWLADLVLTISKHSRRDLLGLADDAGLDAPPVAVLRLGDELTEGAVPRRPRCLPEAVSGPFVLTVGNVEVRKNHGLLYHLWRELVRARGPSVPPLLLAGRPGWLTAELLQQASADPLLAGRLVALPAVTDPELRWLYRHCLFTLYPSHYEGWGLPVAESLAHGRYCVCSSSSSLPEIAPGLVGLHHPLDLPACRALVEQALFQPGFLATQEQRIRELFRVTPWHETAAQLLQALQQHLRIRWAAGPLAA